MTHLRVFSSSADKTSGAKVQHCSSCSDLFLLRQYVKAEIRNREDVSPPHAENNKNKCSFCQALHFKFPPMTFYVSPQSPLIRRFEEKAHLRPVSAQLFQTAASGRWHLKMSGTQSH